MRKFVLVLIVALAAAAVYQLGYRTGHRMAESPSTGSEQSTDSKPAVRMERAPSRNTNRSEGRPAAPDSLPTISASELPREAAAVLAAIRAGGPYDYPRDGITFQNRERLLPRQQSGYYREFTVRTPGESDRGARRIVTGGKPAIEFFWSNDHYQSFQRIRDVP